MVRAAGCDDLAELQAHPFFAGVDWRHLLEQEAPQFVQPPAPEPANFGLDWDLNAYTGSQPVKYSYEPTGSLESAPSGGAVSVERTNGIARLASGRSSGELDERQPNGWAAGSEIRGNTVRDGQAVPAVADQLQGMHLSTSATLQGCSKAAGLVGPAPSHARSTLSKHRV